MYFNSYIFILAFLPIVLVCYYLLNRTGKYLWGKIWLLAASLFFVGYLNKQYALYAVLFIAVGYVFITIVSKEKYSVRVRKTGLMVGILFHVSGLLYFKYCNFFIDNINQFLEKEIPMSNSILPIGISFYTFQQIAYLVDCYRNPSVTCSLLEYALYIVFFPQFLQGPILLHEDMLPQLRDETNKQFSMEHFCRGLYAFAMGLGKKVLLADNIAYIVNAGYGNVEQLTSVEAMLTMLAYSLQLYFDFSGYSDMAVGLGEMFQIQIPINFNSPYKAVKITDIWSRWHMTLTRFFTKYVYIPLGGNRKGAVRMYVNTFIVFGISGLWHGAAWTFIIWGILHGFAMVISKFLDRCKIVLPKVIGWSTTFLFWVMSFAIFRAGSLEEAKMLFIRLIYGGMGEMNSFFWDSMKDHLEIRMIQRLDIWGIWERFPEMLVFLTVLLPLLGCLVMKNTNEKLETLRFTYQKLFVTVVVLFYSIVSLGGMNVFLYTNF